jgi:membrane protein YdbS with pleckstrin-like domain
MLTKEETDFIVYWEQNRLKKKKVLRQLYVGLPLAVVMVIAIFANFFSGWYKRAEMVMRREQSSLVLVLMIAALLIVIFVVIFSARHRWDINEQRYRELLYKKENNKLDKTENE